MRVWQVVKTGLTSTFFLFLLLTDVPERLLAYVFDLRVLMWEPRWEPPGLVPPLARCRCAALQSESRLRRGSSCCQGVGLGLVVGVDAVQQVLQVGAGETSS